MDVTRLVELKNDLLRGELPKHRRLLIALGLFMAAFCVVSIVGGYFLVTYAMDYNQVSAQRDTNTPSDISLLFAGHRPYQLVNDLVFLNRVKLEPATESGNLYYAGDQSGNRVLVLARKPGLPGDESTASVMGTVRPVSSQLLKKWKLSKEEQKVVKSQGVYLEAESVKVQKNPATLAKQ